MELGKRLKQARLEMGLSQRQLCGEEITRNMLSQIENGSARPSMTTLEYLARKLNKPISYFLEEQAVTSPNQAVMAAARQAFSRQDYGQIPALLEDYKAPDDVFDAEKYLLEALCKITLARQVFDQGKSLYAQTLLQQAKQAGEHTVYYTAEVERQRLLVMYQICPEQAATLESLLPAEDWEQLLRAEAALSEKEYARCAGILDSISGTSPRRQLLRGQAALGLKDYPKAAECFLQAEEAYPDACAKALETCYREMEDFKQAYYYACKQRL